MDEVGSRNSQQTNTETEKQTPQVVTHKWEFNENTWIQGGEHHTLGPVGAGVKRGIALGEIRNIDNGLMGAANHHGTCIPM